MFYFNFVPVNVYANYQLRLIDQANQPLANVVVAIQNSNIAADKTTAIISNYW